MPGPDHDLSPVTGWTREHWVSLADRTVRAVQPWATPRHALVHLPGPQSRSGRLSDGLEGYARTFLTAAFRIAGDPGSTGSEALAQWYADGLLAGTDAASGEAWPTLSDVHQARVEAASVAIGLHETRSVIWERLGDAAQQRIAHWLGGAVGVEYPGNNWVWFQNVVQAFLGSVGAPTSQADVDRNLARIEQWYSGDGWYTDGSFADGEHRCYDHYSGWAMHFYPLWWCRMLGARVDTDLERTYRERLHLWLGQAQHLVGGDGAPLYHGRSLTYRHAVLAPFWAGAVGDVTPLTPGRTRRLASGVLRHFATNGGWDCRSLQPIGWHGERTAIRQWYSGPGSPYWSSKGFAGLVLPPDHPVWTAVEEPLESELGDVSVSWPVPGWLVSATRADGVVRLVNHGGDHWSAGVLGLDDTVYGRLSYSGAVAPDSGLAAEASPVDSSVVLVDSAGRASHRRPLERVYLAGHVGVSRHRAHWLVGEARDPWQQEADQRPDAFEVGPWLTLASVLRGAIEVRLVRVDADADPLHGPAADFEGGRATVHPGPWRLRIGGHTVADVKPPDASTGRSAGGQPAVEVGVARGTRAGVVGLLGSWNASVHRTAGANAFGHHAATPLLTSPKVVADGDVAGVAVLLAGGTCLIDATTVQEGLTAAAPSWPASLPQVGVRHDDDGCTATVTWPGGETDRFRLDPPRLRR